MQSHFQDLKMSVYWLGKVSTRGGNTKSLMRRLKRQFERAATKVELAGALAFARYVGLRIPSEIRDLKFADFHEVDGQIGLFDVPQSGKTGFRRVPMFDELRPHFEALRSVAKPGQVYVFEKYRKLSSPIFNTP